LLREGEFAPKAPAPAATPTEPVAAETESPAAATSDEPSAETPAAETPAAESDAEASADEQASWTPAERRIYGALQKERQANKELRAQLRESKAASPATPATSAEADSAAKARPATPETATPATVPMTPLLANCNTFEQVDQVASEANHAELVAFKALRTLDRQDRQGVDALLTQEGVTKINGMPLAEVDDATVQKFLESAYEGSRQTQAQVLPRKQAIVAQAEFVAKRQANWNEAAKLRPEINDVNSPLHKRIKAVTDAKPWLLNDVEGPMQVLKYVLGDELLKPAPAKPAAAAPAVRQAPGAPRKTAAALPPANVLAAIEKKMADGTATEADLKAYARAGIAV
jgi:hypothetical protein